jgi:hypothetical protein
MSRIDLTILKAQITKSFDTTGKMENYIRVKVNNGSGQLT